MRSASRALYIVGRIFNIVAMVFSVLTVVVGILFISLKGQIADAAATDAIKALDDPKEVEILGIIILVSALVHLIVTIVIFILATNASKKIKEGSAEVAPHVVMLIIGIFGDFFYFLGGIFGLVAVKDNSVAK